MSRRSKALSPPASLYEDAYRWQRGEFYPEHHQSNIQRLHQKYPGHSVSEINAIYRQACRIDFEVQERVGKSKLSEGVERELLSWLEDHFHGFNRESFLWAIEKTHSG
jgi:hypothetical protein